jgi:hypothetical protein
MFEFFLIRFCSCHFSFFRISLSNPCATFIPAHSHSLMHVYSTSTASLQVFTACQANSNVLRRCFHEYMHSQSNFTSLRISFTVQTSSTCKSYVKLEQEAIYSLYSHGIWRNLPNRSCLCLGKQSYAYFSCARALLIFPAYSFHFQEEYIPLSALINRSPYSTVSTVFSSDFAYSWDISSWLLEAVCYACASTSVQWSVQFCSAAHQHDDASI